MDRSNSSSKAVACQLIILFFITLQIGCTLAAQELVGSITGTVNDKSGAVVPGVQMKISIKDQGFERTAVTKEDGSLRVADLPIGTYTITVSKPGFETGEYSGIQVDANHVTSFAARLQVGSQSTTVEVHETPLLNRVDTAQGYTLDPQIMENTPLGTGSFTQLALLSPGVNVMKSFALGLAAFKGAYAIQRPTVD